MRADQLLLSHGRFESRKKAQVAIEKGLVSYVRHGKPVPILKPSQDVDWREGDLWQIDEDLEFKYVSRAGAKLHLALEHWNISVQDLLVLDIGLSTGGFADCLLQRGAQAVLGVDVGHSQLHRRMQNRSQLRSLEKWNAKITLSETILADFFQNHKGQSQFDLIVMDVSFISMRPVLDAQWRHLRNGGSALVLFKPQFEVGSEFLDKKGCVSDQEGLRVLEKTVKTLNDGDKKVRGTFPSAIRGEDGNQEYFIDLQKERVDRS